jgi:hypothetical protein
VTLPGRDKNGPSPEAYYIMSTPERFEFESGDGLAIACSGERESEVSSQMSEVSGGTRSAGRNYAGG